MAWSLWLGVTSGVLLVLLVVVAIALGRKVRRLRRQLEEARLHEVQVGATDRLIEFRLRQLTEEIERLERARDEAAREPQQPDTPRHRRLG